MRLGLIPVMLYAFLPLGADNRKPEEIAREIEDNLIAPCCWTQPVSQHYSEVSEQIRKEVRAMLAAGKSRGQIIDHFVAQYGERILAKPRARGFNALAYVLPWAALILGACLLIIIIKSLRPPAAAAGSAQAPPDERYTSIVEKEMKDLD